MILVSAAVTLVPFSQIPPYRYHFKVVVGPRILEDLRERAERVSRKRVIRLMQEDGLQARVRKRFTCTTMSDRDLPIAANVLDRQSRLTGPINDGSVTQPSS